MKIGTHIEDMNHFTQQYKTLSIDVAILFELIVRLYHRWRIFTESTTAEINLHSITARYKSYLQSVSLILSFIIFTFGNVGWRVSHTSENIVGNSEAYRFSRDVFLHRENYLVSYFARDSESSQVVAYPGFKSPTYCCLNHWAITFTANIIIRRDAITKGHLTQQLINAAGRASAIEMRTQLSRHSCEMGCCERCIVWR